MKQAAGWTHFKKKCHSGSCNLVILLVLKCSSCYWIEALFLLFVLLFSRRVASHSCETLRELLPTLKKCNFRFVCAISGWFCVFAVIFFKLVNVTKKFSQFQDLGLWGRARKRRWGTKASFSLLVRFFRSSHKPRTWKRLNRIELKNLSWVARSRKVFLLYYDSILNDSCASVKNIMVYCVFVLFYVVFTSRCSTSTCFFIIN